MKKDNAFEMLVDNLVSGELNITMVCIAIKVYIRKRKDLPDGVKNLLGPHGEHQTGPVDDIFNTLKNIIGVTELAYRRGKQDGEESK